MKFAILSDIHLGPESSFRGVLRKMNKDVKVYLDEFIEEMNGSVKPEFVVVLGDLIQDDNKENDESNISYIVEQLKRLECSVHYVAGNHDLRNISENALAKLLKQESLYYSFDSGKYHFIVLFSKAAKGESILVTDEQRTWLGEDLDGTDRRCVIFVHHGLADQDLAGNPWFEGEPESCLVANREEIRNILEQSKKVSAVFNGHLHWDRQDVHNFVPYFTIQSLTENEEDKGIASKAYAVVVVAKDKVGVEIKGNYPKSFSYPGSL